MSTQKHSLQKQKVTRVVEKSGVPERIVNSLMAAEVAMAAGRICLCYSLFVVCVFVTIVSSVLCI